MKSKGMMLLMVISAAALVSGILLTVQAQNSQLAVTDNQQNIATTTPAANTDSITQATTDQNCTFPGPWMCMGMMPGIRGRGPFGMGFNNRFEVSSDFVQNVTNIAKSDTDVQQLLNNGYNITRVMPVIKTTIDGNGNVVTKATTAELLLENGTTGRALVTVDLQNSKVTQIVTITKTVITKP
jgi:hypothetical protein